jgi:predicted RNase H-like nuclease (RuvC/YqgF family)
MDMLTRNGDDVLVVWDAQRIESDVILRAGLSLAKALCVRKQRERDKKESNWEEVDAAVLAVEKEVTRLAKMRTWTETIQSHSGNILEEIRKMTNSLERQIAVLRESVETLKLS